MDNDVYEEQHVPLGLLTGINFSVATDGDKEKIAVQTISSVYEVTDPRLGLPNPSPQCSTCGAKDLKNCEGHIGVIKFPFTILHPYFLNEVAKILNGICASCKSVRKDRHSKGTDSASTQKPCKYCCGNSSEWYPPMRFKVSSSDIFRRTVIIVEASEKKGKKFPRKILNLAADYWDFIPKDVHQQDTDISPNKIVLSHAQVHYLLKDVDPLFIKKFVPRTELIFLNNFPVTPNRHRIMEFTHALSNGQRLMFDDRTRSYKKLVDFRGIANELSSRVLNCLKISKLSSDNSLGKESVYTQQKVKDTAFHSAGLRWIKDVVLAKRNDYSFRMVVTGDPNIKLCEIGIPYHIAERLQISEHLNSLNWEKLTAICELRLLKKGEVFIHRKDNRMCVHNMDELQIGDTIHRPLCDGDILLINRPPSIHQHSIIALSVKVLPVKSVFSINPLCCSPFRGDFDGDCLHGYIPQSVNSRVELNELVSLDKQLINRQTGRNLLSLSQDSLLALHLLMEDGVLLNRFQMQQLEMFCPQKSILPAIVKAQSLDSCFWTGKQLFSMLLPDGFNYVFPPNQVNINNGELIFSSEGSSWLRDTENNLFQGLVKHSSGKVLDFLHYTQKILCEWLSMRGFSVSLSDLYLSSNKTSHRNMVDEVYCALQEAEQRCNFRQMLVDSNKGFLVGSCEESTNTMEFDPEFLCYAKQTSAALSQASVDSFKQTFRDIQNLVFRYASKDNSLLDMSKAGSKGNLPKLVQHSMCLGLQYSLAPLSFRIPYQLSCASWNSHKEKYSSECNKYIPYAVVENSFLTGLNPLECFVHSITNRDSSFSDNAQLPGTLTRKLMFFMRDLYFAYDGTVRNVYGNQLISFFYKVVGNSSMRSAGTYDFLADGIDDHHVAGGEPVGSLSACAISEAAYSALDQPISILETSPLLNLKNALECSMKRNSDQTVSLFLSKKLEKRRHGFEYAALEVKNHLEKLLFSDIVHTDMIIFSPQASSNVKLSPWVCHFHIIKEIVRRRSLKVHSIIDSLYMRRDAIMQQMKINLPKFQIASKQCFVGGTTKEDTETICITVTIENPKSSIQLEMVQNLVIPILLGTVIKGFMEIKKVDILWKDGVDVSKCHRRSSGELYLKVLMSKDCDRTRLWSILIDDCLKIMDLIDWTRSHPDNINDFCLAYGIDAGWKYFLRNLESAVSDTGKSVLPEHLLLLANCLSVSGSFVGLNAKGIGQQNDWASILSPFARACFSTPGDCFIKAAKAGVTDELKGSLDALAWGRIPPTGTGGQFDIIYSGKGHELAKPADVYNLLGNKINSSKQNVKIGVENAHIHIPYKNGAQFAYAYGGLAAKGLKKLGISTSDLRRHFSVDYIQGMSRKLKHILHQKYSVNQHLSEKDKAILMMALYFHPQKEKKIGTGVQDIKVGKHTKYEDASCFIIERTDGTCEDFSYHKCVLGALEIIAPTRAKNYQTKWLRHDAE